MSFAKILVPLTGTGRDEIALKTAVAAARPFNAHVAALFVHADAREAIPYSGVPISPEVTQTIIDSMRELSRKAAKAAQESISRACEATGARRVEKPRRSDGVTMSFREVEGHFPECVSDAGKLSDIIVFAPRTDPVDSRIHDAIVETLNTLRRPVLLCGTSAPPSLTGTIIVGWDGGLAAAHALSTALPFLKHAKNAEILALHRPGSDPARMDEASEYLSLHGIDCELHTAAAPHGSIGDALQSEAANRGANLLVIGGYGHSRLLETIFGGVTVEAIGRCSLPILLVH